MKVKLKIISEISEFEKLQDAWHCLLENSENESVYLTWEWLFNWWKYYKSGRELFLVVAKDGSELLGVIPLVVRRYWHLGVCPLRTLEFLSTGENQNDEVCPSRMGLIAKRGEFDKVCESFAHFLTGESSGAWDQMVLKPLVEKAEGTRRLVYFLRQKQGVSVELESLGNICYTELMPNWDETIATFGRKTRKRIRQMGKTIENFDEFSYAFVEVKEDFRRFFDEFVRLHLKRWRNRGAFSSKTFAAFQKRICEVFWERGWLSLSLMKINKKVVAGNLDFRYKDCVFGYQTAYDPDFESKIGLGILGMMYCLEDAVKRGFRFYDWYFASEGSYKLHFATFKEKMVALKCFNGNTMGRVGRLIENAKNEFKRI